MKRCEARKSRVHHPKLIARPSHFMRGDVSRHKRIASDEARVVLAHRFHLRRQIRNILQEPNLRRRSDRQAMFVQGEPRGWTKLMKRKPQCLLVRADHNQLAASISRDQQRSAQLRQDPRQRFAEMVTNLTIPQRGWVRRLLWIHRNILPQRQECRIPDEYG